MSRKTSTSKKSARKSRSAVAPIGALTRSTDRSRLSQNTWVVFRDASERKPLLFEGRLTRDQVRTAYSRETGVSHNRTRSRRLENY
jgi:hypothetical protein